MADPIWLDRTAYPFSPHYLELEAGRMHYVDEGEGAPVLMLHGNPTWSFLYRHLIRHLSSRYRCVAPDYLGFGLSDKPAGWSYHPRDQAAAVETLIERLDLADITLVVHDWGGPIGLSCALQQPDRVKRIVLMNTWMWPLNDKPRFVLFSKGLGGPVGRFLIERYNFFARVVLPLCFGRWSRLSQSAYRHYTAPLDRPAARKGSWVFARELVGASTWLEQCWRQREKLAGKPALILWGMKDPAFRQAELARWQSLWPTAQVEHLPTVGHYVPEELGPSLGGRVASFLP